MKDALVPWYMAGDRTTFPGYIALLMLEEESRFELDPLVSQFAALIVQGPAKRVSVFQNAVTKKERKKERYRKSTFICEQQILCHFTLLRFKYVR